jgi:putative phosphoesterase
MSLQNTNEYLIGVISDTHGLLRPEVAKALEGANLIIHAGDIGKPEVLEALRAFAPVIAVRGNMDWGPWARALPETQVVEIDKMSLYVIHDADELDLEPASAGFRAVIYGHTHEASIDERNGVLFLNPGSAGPLRSPASVALVRVRGMSIDAQLVVLKT